MTEIRRTMLPAKAESVSVVEPAPLAAVKSLFVLGAVNVIVLLLPIHTRPWKVSMVVPTLVASTTVNTAPSHCM